MSIRYARITIVLTVLLWPVAGRAFDDGNTTISRNWGTSFQAQKNVQIANPDAGAVTGPIEGFEGRAAENTMDVYHKSFSQQETRKGYTLDNIGVMVGGSN